MLITRNKSDRIKRLELPGMVGIIGLDRKVNSAARAIFWNNED